MSAYTDTAPASRREVMACADDHVSTAEWMWTLFLTGIPVVGLVLLFIWAFGGGAKVSKRSFARAALLWMAIGVAVSIVVSIIAGGSLMLLFNSMNLPNMQ